MYWSSFSYIDDMLSAGAKLYRYKPGFMHQKVMLIDNQLASVGTANLDNRSFYLNFELNIMVSNPTFAMQVEEMLKRDFEQCREVTEEEYRSKPWFYRAAIRLARIASPVQ